MKKFLFTLLLPFLFLASFAQDKSTAKKLVVAYAQEAKMSQGDVDGFYISDAYTSEEGILLVYANQEYKSVPVMNQIRIFSFKNDKLLANSGSFIQNMEAATAGKSATPSIQPSSAVQKAFAQKRLPTPALNNIQKTADNKYDFGIVPGVTEKVTATLLWVVQPFSAEVKLAWQVQVVPVKSDDYLLINIDAHTGAYLNELNLTVYEQFNKTSIPALLKKAGEAITKQSFTAKNNAPLSPTLINSANYTVIPYPVEAPNSGSAATRSNPWSAAPGNATTLNWHSDGTTDYIISRGNNVWATEDRAATNTNSGAPATSTTTTEPLNFLFTPNYNVDPTTTDFQRFATTNLFYWNNVIHDITYNYGFTEVAGNFQKNNLSRGGNQADDVIALAQSGSGTNNANFSTPGDGGRGRMRMYLWDPAPSTTLTVNSPGTIAGPYTAVESGFSTANKLCDLGAVSGQVVYFNDASGGTHDACTGPPSNSLTGKIALIDRNVCGFTIKVKEAQLAGAIAVIMVNNVPGAPIIMGGTDNTITIPAIMVTQSDGAILAAQLANNVVVTMSSINCKNLDGDLDAGIIAHEYGHGISNRFTGGPSAAGCLQNAEQGGEGWSDYIGLMLTTNWATATVNDGIIGRGIGTYVTGQTPAGTGIRQNRYSTDMSLNPLTYANMGVAPIGTSVHNIGEIWCMSLWEMTWGLIQASNSINTNFYNYTAASNGGNTVAFKLVTEGMKLQPCSPGYIDARNAIMAADRNLYNGANACTIWTAFAKRGMGFGSSQGSSASATDQTSTTTMPPAPTVTAQPQDVTANVGTTATFTASAGTDPNLIYQWQVSTDGGTTWTDIVGQISSTLTLNSVAAGMNGFKYRARVFYACASTNTNSATLTITGAPSVPVITSQPANVSVCAGSNATFTVTVTGTDLTYVWQVSTNGGTSYTNVTPAATTASLTLSNVTTAMNGNLYRVVVTNPAGSATSNPATLTVTPASTLTIATQPANTAVCSGSNATFTVATTGSPVSYNWQVSTDGGTTYTDISPAVTTATLTLTGVTVAMNNNRYRVIVTGGCPVTTITSNAAILTVNSSTITITQQPANASVCSGSTATFSVTATGTNLVYQWQVSTDGGATFGNITGATSATYTTAPTAVGMNNNRYRVLITNPCVTTAVTSTAAILTVSASSTVAITSQPANVTACSGTTATITVGTSGTPIAYNWQVSTDGGATYTDISPAVTTQNLTLTNVTTAMNNNRYRVVVTGGCPVTTTTSTAAILTVNSSTITITQNPANATVCSGANASFSVTATGTGLNYQWQVSTDGGATFTNVTGATNTTYTISPTTLAMNNNRYRAVVSNTCNTGVTSTAATLTVGTTASITNQPISTIACEGTNVTFAATVTGSVSSYQWQVSTNGGTSFTNVATGTGPSLTLTGVTAAMNNNQYRLQVTGVCNNVTSSTVTLTVNSPASITQQPTDKTVCDSASVSFSVSASGTTINYQWQVSMAGGAFSNITNGGPYSGATTNTLTINPATLSLSGNRYRVVIAGSPCGTATSTAANLTVNAKPSVLLAEAVSGGVSGYQVSVSPAGTYTYQWYNNGVLVPALTTAFIPTSSTIGGSYYVVVTSSTGCSTQSNSIVVQGYAGNSLFIFPNPNNGNFQIRHTIVNAGTGAQSSVRGMVIYDSKGSRVYQQEYSITGTTSVIDVKLPNLAAGFYGVDLVSGNGERLASGRFVITAH